MPVLRFMAVLRASTPPEPEDGTGKDHQTGQKEHTRKKQLALLRFREDDAPVRGILGSHRNKIFILSQPIDGVHKEVAIALQPRPLVGGEGGIAYDDKPRALAGISRAGRMALGDDAQRERSGLVFRGIVANFFGIQVRNREATRRSLEQLSALRIALALIF